MVRTRFAPSPTGTPESIHLGFVIRALWNFAYAKKYNGQFLLRMEDTDIVRSRKDTELAIYETLREFGINWDEGPDVGGPYAPYRQSDRLSKYQEAAHKLVELGFAYYDFDAEVRETAEIKAQYEDEEAVAKLEVRPAARFDDIGESKKRIENGEKFVVRVKIPEDREFKFKDWILGKEIKVKGKIVPDLILLKSNGFPTYHLAVVVDDIDMKISHVFRGLEWISTTPIHLYLYEAFGTVHPEIGHFTVIIDPRTNKKFSKRDMSGMFGVNTWLKAGYLKPALLNYLMMLGWAPKDNRELFTMDEFVQAFDQDGVGKANPVFDKKKLDWFQGTYIRKLSIDELLTEFQEWIVKHSENQTHFIDIFSEDEKMKVLKETLPVIQERITTFVDIEGCIMKMYALNDYIDFSIVKGIKDKNKTELVVILDKLISVCKFTNDKANWELTIREIAKSTDMRDADVFMLLRIAIWGDQFSPPLFEIMQILGSELCSERLTKYKEYLT